NVMNEFMRATESSVSNNKIENFKGFPNRETFISFYNLYVYLTAILVDFTKDLKAQRSSRILLNLKNLNLDIFNKIITKYDYYLFGVTQKILEGHTSAVSCVAVLGKDRIV